MKEIKSQEEMVIEEVWGRNGGRTEGMRYCDSWSKWVLSSEGWRLVRRRRDLASPEPEPESAEVSTFWADNNGRLPPGVLHFLHSAPSTCEALALLGLETAKHAAG